MAHDFDRLDFEIRNLEYEKTLIENSPLDSPRFLKQRRRRSENESRTFRDPVEVKAEQLRECLQKLEETKAARAWLGEVAVLRFSLHTLQWQKRRIETEDGMFAEHDNPAEVRDAALRECLAQLNEVETKLVSLSS